MIEKPNIFLVTIDCLRYDYLGCFGNKENLSPNIDKIASDGVLFKKAFVNGPSTPFSFPSIFTSSYPLIDPNFPKLSRNRTSLSKILNEIGYETIGINSNPYLSKFYGFDIGFTFFDDIFSEKNKEKTGIKGFIKRHKILKSIIIKAYKTFSIKYKTKPPYQRANTINDKALTRLKKSSSEIFLWLHYMDTHHPFFPPKKFRNTSKYKMYHAEKLINKNSVKISKRKLKNIKEQYKSTIRYVDYELGRFISELKNLGIYDNSLIIITADHGEEFKEHGGFSHQCKLYDELIHVPLIIKGLLLPKNLRIENIVSLIDLAPTLLEYLNLKKNNDFLGESLLPLLIESDKKYKRQSVVCESLSLNGKVSLLINDGFRVTSYRTDNWKFIFNEETKEKELYNLNLDPKELHNVYNNNIEIANKFETKLKEFIELETELRNNLRGKNELKKIIKGVSLSDLGLNKKEKS